MNNRQEAGYNFGLGLKIAILPILGVIALFAVNGIHFFVSSRADQAFVMAQYGSDIAWQFTEQRLLETQYLNSPQDEVLKLIIEHSGKMEKTILKAEALNASLEIRDSIKIIKDNLKIHTQIFTRAGNIVRELSKNRASLQANFNESDAYLRKAVDAIINEETELVIIQGLNLPEKKTALRNGFKEILNFSASAMLNMNELMTFGNKEKYEENQKKLKEIIKISFNNTLGILLTVNEEKYNEFWTKIVKSHEIIGDIQDKIYDQWKLLQDTAIELEYNNKELKKSVQIAVTRVKNEKENINKNGMQITSFTIIVTLFLLSILSYIIILSITKRLKRVAWSVKKVAEGELYKNLEFTVSDMKQKDEIGIITRAVSDMQAKIRKVLKETESLIRTVQEGKLEIRGNTKIFEGGWCQLITGINNLIDAFAIPINVTAETIDKIARGDVPEKITQEYKGDFDRIKNNLNTLIDVTNETTRIAEEIAAGNLAINVKQRSADDRLMKALASMIKGLEAILNETDELIGTIREGRLNVRGNAELYKGGWKKLVSGINSLINAFTGPINKTSEYIERISKGDIPEIITENYKGNFNEIKNNLNTLINTTLKITEKAQEIAAGNLKVKVEKRSDHDAMMKAFESMIEYIRDVSDITEKVSNNKLDVKVVPKSDKDLLNRSLQIMIKNLRDMLDDIQNSMNTVKQQNWLKNGMAELGNAMRGEQDVSMLAQNIISFLADYLNARIGTIYLKKEKDKFYLAGTYACEKSKGIPEIIEAGEGLTGQAVLEKKNILFSNVPKNYLNIYSGLGQSAPKNILVFPLIYEEQVKGVAELGTFGNFSEIETDFLNRAAENIAIAFDAAQTRDTMKILLEESRQQAEELRMQQAELQAVNRELELKNGI